MTGMATAGTAGESGNRSAPVWLKPLYLNGISPQPGVIARPPATARFRSRRAGHSVPPAPPASVSIRHRRGSSASPVPSAATAPPPCRLGPRGERAARHLSKPGLQSTGRASGQATGIGGPPRSPAPAPPNRPRTATNQCSRRKFRQTGKVPSDQRRPNVRANPFRSPSPRWMKRRVVHPHRLDPGCAPAEAVAKVEPAATGHRYLHAGRRSPGRRGTSPATRQPTGPSGPEFSAPPWDRLGLRIEAPYHHCPSFGRCALPSTVDAGRRAHREHLSRRLHCRAHAGAGGCRAGRRPSIPSPRGRRADRGRCTPRPHRRGRLRCAQSLANAGVRGGALRHPRRSEAGRAPAGSGSAREARPGRRALVPRR